jgi:cell wall-associated NlpC family hydrolase
MFILSVKARSLTLGVRKRHFVSRDLRAMRYNEEVENIPRKIPTMTRFSFRKNQSKFYGGSVTLPMLGVLLASAPAAVRATPQIATAPVSLAQSSVAGAAPSSSIAAPSRLASHRAQRTEPSNAALTSPQTFVTPGTMDVQVTIAPSDAKTVVAKKAESAQDAQEKLLLAKLDADLKRTEKRLGTTSDKLSAGQKELMALNSTLQAVMNENGADASGLNPFVRVASRYAGTPYVWGGESRFGFDCSGFIIRVMRDLGYKALPHSAAEQFKYGTPIAQSLLKPGDIVFFANTYKPGISHVGIYVGKRRFIHAASTRQGTIVSSLDASPYKQKYAGARRLAAVKR